MTVDLHQALSVKLQQDRPLYLKVSMIRRAIRHHGRRLFLTI